MSNGMTVVVALGGLVLTLIGVIAAMYFGVIGTKASKRQERQDREDYDWQLKHETVALQLSRINPNFNVLYPDKSTRMIYTDLFPDPKFRQSIENYIVEVDRTHTIFTPRKPTPHELRSPALRDTVTKTAAALDALRRDNPTVAYHFNGK
jgi:hypothetical protein